MKQLFQGGILVNGSGYRKADLLIENDKILDVGTGLSDPEDRKSTRLNSSHA